MSDEVTREDWADWLRDIPVRIDVRVRLLSDRRTAVRATYGPIKEPIAQVWLTGTPEEPIAISEALRALADEVQRVDEDESGGEG